MSKTFGLAVRAFVADRDGRVLLVRRSLQSKHFPHKWELPGGKVDAGENFDVAAAREVAEETGLTISIEGVAGATGYELPRVHVATLFLEARHVAGEVRLSDEHDAFDWVPREELSAADLSEQMKDFVTDGYLRARSHR